MSDDLTVHILKEIRDEIRGTKAELVQTRTELRAEIAETRTELRAEISSVREELAQTRDDLGTRITEVELRLATSYTALIASTRDVHELLINNFGLRDRVEACEHDIEDLKRQIPHVR